MPPKTLLDTDVLSEIMRRNPTALTRSVAYLSDYPQLSISIINRFEILRGLKAKGSVARVAAFDQFCAGCEVLSQTDRAIVTAADMYADLYRRGQLIGDADILIAAVALTENLALATNNATHFSRIPGLRIESWV